MRHKRVLGITPVIASIALMVGVAVGSTGAGVTAVTIGAGTIAQPIGIPQEPGESTWITQTTVAPDGTTGWHSHPGKTLVVVASGTLTLHRGTTVNAAFVRSRPAKGGSSARRACTTP